MPTKTEMNSLFLNWKIPFYTEPAQNKKRRHNYEYI